MSGGVTPDLPRRVNRRGSFPQSVLEKRGLKFEIGAPVTGATAAGEAIAVASGDGPFAISAPKHPPPRRRHMTPPSSALWQTPTMC